MAVLIHLRCRSIDRRAAQDLHELPGASVEGCIDGESDAKMFAA